jgi:glutaredoxin
LKPDGNEWFHFHEEELMNSRALFLALIPLMAVQALADIYSWTDRNGVKHYSNDPPPKNESVTDLIVIQESREEAIPETAGPDESKTNPAGKHVIIYVDPQSDYCREALAFFDANSIAYTKVDITSSDEDLQRFKSLGGAGTPLIFIGEQRLDGWNEKLARQYLGMSPAAGAAEEAAGALSPVRNNGRVPGTPRPVMSGRREPVP